MHKSEALVRRLAVAMLRTSISDIEYRHPDRCQALQAWRDAVSWIEVEGDEAEGWALSFENCCAILNINSHRARVKLLAMAYEAERECQNLD